MHRRDTLSEMAADGSGADLDRQLLAELSIGLWRLARIVGEADAQERGAALVSRLQLRLQQAGYLVEDRTGQLYDPGMPLKVVASVADRNLRKAVIIQTTSPAVLKDGFILRSGEVVVGSPEFDGETS